MGEYGRKIGRSLAAGQIVCFLIALVHWVWRLVQFSYWLLSGHWYIVYASEHFVWSLVQLVLTAVLMSFTFAMFDNPKEQDDAEMAITPIVVCLASTIAIIFGIENGMTLIHGILFFVELACYLIAIIA